MRQCRSLPLAAFLLVPSVAGAAPSVWVVDDGEKIRRDATSTAFERGVDNPVWRPGEPVRLFAIRNESVALQVVVEADEAPLGAVTVGVLGLNGPGGAQITEGNARPEGPRPPIERFVESFVVVKRASGGRTTGESLGWDKGAAPAAGAWVGPVPDALVPVELAPRGRLYPMRIEAHSNGIVWIDVNVPRDQPPGMYRGNLDVRDGERPLAAIALELEVAEATLPDRTVGTMLFYDPEELEKRVGPHAEESLWKLLHAHRIAPLHDALTVEDVRRQRDALDGTLYTRARGYNGPAAGIGDGVLSVGAYGALGNPDARGLSAAAAIADAIASANLFEKVDDVFLYAADEQCASDWGAGWRSHLRASPNANLRRLRVGWTCSEEPASQPVDIVMALSAYDAAQARDARDRGKAVWVYNGILPRAGTFLLDAAAVSPRVNGWLSAMFGVPRWFYWEATYWYGRKGSAPIDPFVEPESLHNDDGDWANGDGVLVYPGQQLDGFREHSFGFEGVFASIRLKNWRRGIEDAGYVLLARARDRARADAVTRALIPAAFGSAPAHGPPSWGERGAPFFNARRALLSIALGRAQEPHPVLHGALPVGGRWQVSRWRRAAAIGGVSLALAASSLLGMRQRRRRRSEP